MSERQTETERERQIDRQTDRRIEGQSLTETDNDRVNREIDR